MYAVIETGGKQYRVEVGTELEVELLEAGAGEAVAFDRVLLVADGETASIGRPVVANASVSAEVLRRDRGEKLISFKYRPEGAAPGQEGPSPGAERHPDQRHRARRQERRRRRRARTRRRAGPSASGSRRPRAARPSRTRPSPRSSPPRSRRRPKATRPTRPTSRRRRREPAARPTARRRPRRKATPADRQGHGRRRPASRGRRQDRRPRSQATGTKSDAGVDGARHRSDEGLSDGTQEGGRLRQERARQRRPAARRSRPATARPSGRHDHRPPARHDVPRRPGHRPRRRLHAVRDDRRQRQVRVRDASPRSASGSSRQADGQRQRRPA